MKKIIAVLLITLLTVSISCKKSGVSYSPDCTGATPTFTSNVSPLISTYCATSGCHASGSHNGPGALISYAQIKSATTDIRSSVVSGSMPENTSLTSAQRNVIVCWIDAGAANN